MSRNGAGTVTVIDGATNNTTNLNASSGSPIVAVNPVTNQIYAANYPSSVTVIDGATNNTTTVAVGSSPEAVAVNTSTNKIYVANALSNNVTVIDGATNTTTTVAVGSGPDAVAVNSVTNQIYVANVDSNNVTVIDGATNNTTTVAVGMQSLRSLASQLGLTFEHLNALRADRGEQVVQILRGMDVRGIRATDNAYYGSCYLAEVRAKPRWLR